MIDLKGKNALVTGSSRGVGQQLAQALAKLGCNCAWKNSGKLCKNAFSFEGFECESV